MPADQAPQPQGNQPGPTQEELDAEDVAADVDETWGSVPDTDNPEIAGQPYSPEANPEIPDSCGLDLTLALDASGSIQSSNAVDDVRVAAETLLDSLTNTNSTAKITQFATVAETLAESTQIDSETMAPGGVLRQALNAYYDPRPSTDGIDTQQYDGSGSPFSDSNWDPRAADQFTNWDQSLATAPTDPPGDKTVGDLVVWITDGDPTAYDFVGDPDPFPTGAVGYRVDRSGIALAQAKQRAVFEANRIKAAGTRIVAIGVGAALQNTASVHRLEDIAGPNSTSDLDGFASINDVDVALVEDFEDLAGFLEDVVHSLCSPSLTIRKLAQEVNEGPYLPAAGWDMTVTPEVPAGSFDWVLPDTAPAASKTVATGPDGFAQFQWSPTPELSDSRATVRETLLPGYGGGRPGEDNDWTCSFRDEDGNVRTERGDFEDRDAPSFVLERIGSEIVTCDVYNSLPPLGVLTIVKDLAGDGAQYVPAGTVFTVEVTCDLDGATVFGAEVVELRITTPAGGIALIPGIPAGAVCTVAEIDSLGAAEVEIRPSQVTISEDGTPVSVFVTNTFDTGSARFTKTVTGSLADIAPDEFTVAVSCEFLGKTISPPFEVVFGPDAPGLLDGLPIGATCTVTETGTGGADTTTITPDQFTVTDSDTPVDVSVVNDYPAANLVIEKELAGDGAGFVPDGMVFQIRVVCDGKPGIDTVFDVGVGLPALITDQAVGANCQVTELGGNGAAGWTVSPNPIPPLVEGGDPVTVTVTNTFQTDTFTLTKLIDGPGAGFVPPGLQFAVDVNCTYLGQPVADFDPYTVQLTAGETVVVGPLPVGAECTVEELRDSAPRGSPRAGPERIIVGIGDADAVELTNRFLVGALELSKVIGGPGKPFVPAGVEYPIEVRCTFIDEPVAGFNPAKVSLTDGEQTTLEPLPLGAECTALETDLMNALNVDYRPDDSVVIESPTTPASIVVANGYGVGEVEVIKDITGPGAGFVPPGSTFTFTVSCTFMGQPLDDRTLVLTAPDDLFGDIEGLPTGAECTIAEQSPTRALALLSPTRFTIGSSEDIVLVQATNRYLLGSVAVEKVLDGAGAALATGPFEIELACTFLGADLPVQTVTLTPPGELSGTFDDLPVGAECTATETADGGASDVVIDPETLTVQAFTPVQLTVANTFEAGSLLIEKIIDGDAGLVDGTFQFDITCQLLGTDLDPQPGTATIAPPATSVEIPGLPAGSTCTVTELAPYGGADGPAVIKPATITINANDTVEVSATNTFTEVAIDPVEPEVLGPVVIGPDAIGPDVVGPDVLGPGLIESGASPGLRQLLALAALLLTAGTILLIGVRSRRQCPGG